MSGWHSGVSAAGRMRSRNSSGRWNDPCVTTLGAVVLFPLAVFFGLFFLYLLVGGRTLAEAWCPGTAGLLCLAGAVALLRWLFRRRSDDLLMEARRLQAQALEFEDRLSRRR
jgi:hypothetical protein